MQKLLFYDFDETESQEEAPKESTKSVFDEMQALMEKKESLSKHIKRKVKYD